MRSWKLPVFGTLAYMLAGSAWILTGHVLSGALYGGNAAQQFELLKGLIFVGITGAVLFIALSFLDRRNPDHLIANDLGAEFARSLKHGDFVVRWLPGLVVAVYCILFVVIASALWWVRDHTLENGERSALALQKAQAAQFSSSLDVINFTLSDIVKDVLEKRMANPENELRAHIPDITSSVSSIGMIDAGGKVIAHTNPSALHQDQSTRDYFLFHSNNPNSGLHLTKPFRDDASEQLVIIVSRPIRTPSGRFMGIIVSVIDPAIFGAYWRQTTDDGSTLSVYDQDDTLLLRSPFNSAAIGKSDWHPLEDSVRSKNGEIQTFRAASTLDGEDRVYATGIVPGYPTLRLMVGIPKSQLLASWHAFAFITMALYLLIASTLAALTFALLRQLRERLVLQRKAAELARYPLQNRNAVITISPAGRRLFMNKAARELADSVTGEQAERLDRQLKAIAAETSPGTHEITVGSRVFTASYVPHQPDYCDIYLTDITSLRRGEDLLHLFFDLPFIGMAITSPETKRWTRFNEELCTILGYTRSELELKTWTEVTHAEDLAADVGEFERVMRDESDSYTMEKRFIRKNGAVINAIIDVHAIRRPDRSIECFVATIQDITERKKAEQRLRDQRNLYAALSDTNEAIIRIRDRNALLARVCEVAARQTGIAFAWAGLISQDGKISPAAKFGDDKGILERAVVNTRPGMPTECAAAARAIANNRIEVVNRWEDDPALAPWLSLFAEAGFQSLLVLPIREKGVPVATLHLYSRQRDYFGQDIVELLARMRADLDNALDGLQAEAERQRAVAELARAEERWQFALEGGDHGVWEWNIGKGTVYYSPRWKRMLGYEENEIGDNIENWRTLIHPDDLATIESEIRCYMAGECPAYRSEHRLRCKNGSYKWVLDQGKITARGEDGTPLVMIGTHTDISDRKLAESALRDSEQRFKALVEQSLVGIYVIDEEKLLYVNPRFCEIYGYSLEELVGKSFYDIIAEEDRPVVREKIRQRLSGETESARYEFRGRRRDGILIDVGVHGSRGMIQGRHVIIGMIQDITERRLGEEKIRSYVERLERSIMSTVQAISQMVDLRDPYTSGHERRVGDLAAAIGREMGMNEHQTTGLRVAGNVHDVGKIAVPAEILSKPTRLSPAEFAIVKTHAEQGYEILKDIDFPWPVTAAVHQHHERLDGSGYPKGLRGDDICIEARILAVADVVESMSTHRPYRPALGVEAAFAELQKHRGILYDPAAVDSCLRLFREKGYTLPQYA